MPHSYNIILIHAIFATKDRMPLISMEIEPAIHSYLKEQLVEMGCTVKTINGMADHLHLLFMLNPQKGIADVIKQVKGSTSLWINEQNLTKEKFAWQTGYAAYSVSESQLEKVYQYILNQKEHHKKSTFTEEYESFMRLHGITLEP